MWVTHMTILLIVFIICLSNPANAKFQFKSKLDHSVPTIVPSTKPTDSPSSTKHPSRSPTKSPSHIPTHKPTHKPTNKPSHKPTHEPTIATPPDHRKLLDVIIGFTTAVVLFSLGLLAFQNFNPPHHNTRRPPTISMSNLSERRNNSGSFPGSYQSLDNSSTHDAPASRTTIVAAATAV